MFLSSPNLILVRHLVVHFGIVILLFVAGRGTRATRSEMYWTHRHSFSHPVLQFSYPSSLPRWGTCTINMRRRSIVKTTEEMCERAAFDRCLLSNHKARLGKHCTKQTQSHIPPPVFCIVLTWVAITPPLEVQWFQYVWGKRYMFILLFEIQSANQYLQGRDAKNNLFNLVLTRDVQIHWTWKLCFPFYVNKR